MSHRNLGGITEVPRKEQVQSDTTKPSMLTAGCTAERLVSRTFYGYPQRWLEEEGSNLDTPSIFPTMLSAKIVVEDSGRITNP